MIIAALYRSRRNSLSLLLCGLIGAALTLSLSGAPATGPDRIVVVISVDGLAGFYLDDPKADMPAIRALAAQGASSALMKASTPTVTWPNHTTLVTGVPPAKHGVIGNNYYDRQTGKRVQLISDPFYDKEQIVRVPTLYDIAHGAGLRTAAIRWPATRNATNLDWTVPDVASNLLTVKYSTPSLLAECREAGIPLGEDSPAAKVALTKSVGDPVYAAAFRLILTRHRPQLAFLHLNNVDHTQHLNGPRSTEAYAAIHDADREVDAVWQQLKRDYPDKATLLVVSDHGFSPSEHTVLYNVVLRQAGLIQTNGDQTRDNPIVIITQGGAALVYARDEARKTEIINQAAQAFEHAQGISGVVRPEHFKDYGMATPQEDPHAPDLLLFAEEGTVFGDTAAGSLPFQLKPERAGSHGHNPNLPHLHAVFVAWGAGIKPGVRLDEINNTQVAPTVARLLGLHIPGVEAQPLSEVLTQ